MFFELIQSMSSALVFCTIFSEKVVNGSNLTLAILLGINFYVNICDGNIAIFENYHY